MAGPLVPRGNAGVRVLSVPVLFGGCPFQKGRQGLPSSIAEQGRRGWHDEQAPSIYTLGLNLGLSLQLSWIRSSFAHHFARAGSGRKACSVRSGQVASSTKGRARGMSNTVARENKDRDEEGLLSL